MPKEIQIAHGLKEGELVSIADAERGLKCNCTCTKCGKPLVAKKGEVNAHYFAHSADSDCNGETYEHIMAKMEIKRKKYLLVPDKRVSPVYQENEREKKLRKKAVNNGEYFPKQYWKNNDGEIFDSEQYKMVSFKTVELEKRIGGSNYIADIICTDESGKGIVIEIVNTHDLGQEKQDYLIKNKIPSLRIDVSKWRVGKKGYGESLNDYILRSTKDCNRKGKHCWIYNPISSQV